jgi:tRNA 2-thiouridine synthesizing protein A
MDGMSESRLDVRRMLCSISVIKTQNKLKQLAVGDILAVVCTDLGVLIDLPAWVTINSYSILDHQQNDNEITIK